MAFGRFVFSSDLENSPVVYAWRTAWNTGTCLYMFWGGLACLNYFINSVIWNKHVMNVAPVWCDISTRIIIAVGVGIPAASLCINRRLYQIASVKSVTITKSQKRRAILVDLAIGLGLPLLDLPLGKFKLRTFRPTSLIFSP